MNLKFKKWVYVCLTFLSIITIKRSHAQCVELVTNGNFETLSSIPPGLSTPGGVWVSYATGWFDYSGTPDLFSALSNPNPAPGTYQCNYVPCNFVGNQNAHSGNTYAGILTSEADGTPQHNLFNGEFFGTTLNSTLASNKMYEVSLWVSRADMSRNEISGLGIWMGGTPGFDAPSYNCPVSLLNNDAWTQIKFTYCGNGWEETLMIGGTSTAQGNTLTATATCTVNNVSAADRYLYIDDISVKEITFAVPTQTLCAKQTGTFTAVPTCSTITTSALTYTWNYGDGSATVSTNTLNVTTHSYAATPSGIYTASLTVGNGTCTKTFTYNVAIPTVTAAITTNTNTICNGNTSFTATPNPAGTYTVSWGLHDSPTYTVIPPASYTVTNGATLTPSINFANVNQNVYVYVVLTSTLGCQYRDSLFMPSCCATSTNVVKHSNKTFTVNTTVATTSISLGGTITVNNNITLTLLQTNAQLDPNTKFVLNGNAKLRFINSYVHGCNYMWDGIYPVATGTVDILNSIVEDAKRVAIDTLGGATILFTNSYINKNNMGIVLKTTKTSTSAVTVKNVLFTCSNVSIPAGSNKTPAVQANLTNAATLGAFTSTVMLLPYNTQKSYCGIYAVDASHTGQTNTAIVIGGTTGQENVFDKMQFGAVIFRSRTAFQNNVFQNIKSAIAPISGGASNTGILAVGPLFGGGGPYYTLIGGASINEKNTFKDNDYGFINYSQHLVTIENNRFENQGTGVFVTANNNRSTVSVAHNKFVNNKIGINFDYNSNIDATILENWMDNTSAQGTYADNYAIRCTEPILTTNPLTYPKYSINNNYINGYYNGITTKLTFQSTITDNEVHMRPDNTAYHFQSGIWIEASNDNLVTKNLVDMPSSNPLQWWHYGIFTAGSTTPKIKCNSTNYVGVGIIANGLNYTTAGDGINGNSMSNAAYGFWLNANGEIGNQYTTNTSTSADNSWTNCGNETYANNGCNQIAAKFYTRSTAPYNIINATQSGTGISLIGIVAPNIASGACYNSISTPTLNLKVAGNGAKKLLMQHADEIANGSIVFAENNESLKQIARKQLYSNLALQQIDQSVSADINTFANNSKYNSLNKFFLVDSLINTGDSSKLNIATVINNNINTNNSDVDATQQQFNTLYINYLKNNRKAKASDIVDFENIAWLCPNINGHAVYQARSVLFNITKQQYINACEKGDPNSSKRFASSVIANTATSVKLFPNPSNGNITIQTDDDLIYNVTVYNLLGEKVFESSVLNKQSINLNNLTSATYIIHIQNNGNLIKTERISIIH